MSDIRGCPNVTSLIDIEGPISEEAIAAANILAIPPPYECPTT